VCVCAVRTCESGVCVHIIHVTLFVIVPLMLQDLSIIKVNNEISATQIVFI